MKSFLRNVGVVSLLLIAAGTTSAQGVEFSADMQVSDGTGQTQTLKLFVGNKRARFDRSKQGNETEGIRSIVIDFQNQFIFLLIPQSKVYLQVEGSLGTPFYRAAWMFRPSTAKYPCNEWVSEGDQRGLSLRCKPAGQETIDSRPTQKWDATTSAAGHGSLWYDPALNFIVKVARTSKGGIQSGYELQNAKVGTQPPDLFEIPRDYRKFEITRLIDILTGSGPWY